MRNLIFPLFAVFVLCSCEKVIDVDVDDTDPEIVIESTLDHGNQQLTTRISYTRPYFENGQDPIAENALVTLRDENGEEWISSYTGDGIYEAVVNSTTETTYTLTVEVDGEEYIANSTLKETVPLIELFTQYTPATGFFDEGYNVYFRYQDPAAVDNYYRLIHSINGETQMEGDDLLTIDDALNDGSVVQFPIFGKSFEVGDSVGVALRHIDQAAYDYFSSLADITSSGGGANSGAAAPGNPISNWSSDALGYFSAFTSDTLSIVVQE